MNVRKDAVANLVGRLWVALMGFTFVPFYIRLLGMGAYGLIGFFASLMGIFAVLDLGLSVTVNREIARLSVLEKDNVRAADLMRTFESIYWVIAAILGVTLFVSAPMIVDHWLKIGAMARDQTIGAIEMMGVIAFLRWPVSLYFGALLGLQQQVRLNVVTSLAATFSGAGATLILMGSPQLRSFFVWQAIVAGVQIVALRHIVWRSIKLTGYQPRLTLDSVRRSLRFSAGITGITLLSIVLTQSDKFVLSRWLPIADFGHYALAGAIAAILTTAGAAVESATFPALSRFVAADDAVGERRLYHQASQGLALLVVPATTALAIFATPLLTAYLGDPVIARTSGPVLSVLAAGNGILALMFLPLSLQLAHGWTRLSLVKNIFAVLLFLPLLVLLVDRFGAIGAAWSWLVLTLGYFLLEVPIMHRRLLPGAQWRWYAQDVGVPVLVSISLIGGARLVLSADASIFSQVVTVVLAASAALMTSAAALPSVRELVVARLHIASSDR